MNQISPTYLLNIGGVPHKWLTQIQKARTPQQDTQTLRAIFCSWRTDDRIPRPWFPKPQPFWKGSLIWLNMFEYQYNYIYITKIQIYIIYIIYYISSVSPHHHPKKILELTLKTKNSYGQSETHLPRWLVERQEIKWDYETHVFVGEKKH